MPFKKGNVKVGGRVKGSLNKSKLDIRELLDKNVDFNQVIKKLIELTNGVEIKKGDNIYSQPPSEAAAKILLEYRFGKPQQAVDVTSGGKEINAPIINVISTDDSEP